MSGSASVAYSNALFGSASVAYSNALFGSASVAEREHKLTLTLRLRAQR